jgi:hypothetical protein
VDISGRYVIKLVPAAQNVKFAVEIKIKTMLKKWYSLYNKKNIFV